MLITLNGVTQTAPIQAGGNFSSSFTTGALTPTNPAYTVAYAYSGDNNFNAVAGSGSLTVSYGVTLLYDPTRAGQGGSTIPLRIQLSNAAGMNVSSAAVTVTGLRLVLTSTNATTALNDSSGANPDNNFRYAGGAYIFNLSTKGLITGTYNLIYMVQGDPVQHALPFQIR